MKKSTNALKMSLLSFCLFGAMFTSCKKDDADTVAPTITLNGSSTVYVQKGQTYSDAGAVGSDNVDGTITVASAGTVNQNTTGTYTISYTGKDNAGNAAAEQKRIVYVVDFTGLYDLSDKVTSTDTSVNGTYTGVANVSVSNSTNNKMTIGNFGAIGNSVYVDATWAGATLTFNGNVVGAATPGTITGSGTISGSTGSNLNVTYKIVWQGGSTDNGVATYTKK